LKDALRSSQSSHLNRPSLSTVQTINHQPPSTPPHAVMMVCGFVMAWQRFYDEESADDEDDEESLAKA